MKRVCFIISLLLLLAFLSDAEMRYVVKVIHGNGSVYYDVNNKGEIAFVGVDAAQNGRNQIFLYTEGKIRQITNFQFPYSYSFYSIDLNNNGDIVWTMQSAQGTGISYNFIMFWDGEKIIKADSTRWSDVFPAINDSSTIVWSAAPGYGAQPEVYKYSAKTTNNISNAYYNPDRSEVISNDGWIVWHGDNRNQNQWWNRIRYIKAGETAIVEIPDEQASFPKIGENNTIIYQKLVSDKGYSSLKMLKGTNLVEIDDSIQTEGSTSYHTNNEWIVYSKLNTNKKYDIYRYSNSGYSIVSKQGTSNYHAKVNNEGTVVWSDDNSGVYVNRQGEIKLIGYGHQGVHPRISDQGIIVWAGGSIGNYYHDMLVCEYKDVYDLSGKVVLQNGSPLIGVNVTSAGDVLATTDATGNFTLTNLDPGEKELTFYKSGYSFDPAILSVNLSGHLTIFPDIVARTTTKIDEVRFGNRIHLNPNPASHSVRISFNPKSSGKLTLDIINTVGQIVYQSNIDNLQQENNQVIINVEDFMNGIYTCRLINGKETTTCKLIVSH